MSRHLQTGKVTETVEWGYRDDDGEVYKVDSATANEAYRSEEEYAVLMGGFPGRTTVKRVRRVETTGWLPVTPT